MRFTQLMPETETDTVNTEKKERWSISPGRLLFWLFVVPLLYFLSFGPAYLLADVHPYIRAALYVFYTPLRILSIHFPPLFHALEWYCTLWGLE